MTRFIPLVVLSGIFLLSIQLFAARQPGPHQARGTNELIRELAVRTNDVLLHVELGDSYRSLGKLGKANEQYQQAIRIDPRNADAYNGLSMLNLRQKQYETAEEYSLAACALKPFNDFYLSQLARAYIKLGKTDEAIKSLEKAVAIHPKQSAYVLGLLAGCYEKKNEFTRAAELMLQQIKSRPWDDSIYVLAARLYYKAEDKTNGDRYKRMAGHTWEDYAEQERSDRVSAAWRFYRSGDYDAALEIFQSLMNDEPENPDHYWAAGMVCQKMDDLDAAAVYFRKGLEKKPDHVKALTGLAGIFEIREDFKLAGETYVRAVSADTNDASAWRSLYRFTMNRKDWTNALTQIIAVTRLDREDHAAWSDMGLVQSKLGNEPSAFEAYLTAFLDGRTKAEQKKYLKKAVTSVLRIGRGSSVQGRKYAARLVPWMSRDEEDRETILKMAGR
jgi:tetratricopeptide (TPR) repeat protein